jgi:hypothetical protein
MAAISIVNNQAGNHGNGSATYALPYNVTNGSTLVWGVVQYQASSSPAAAAPTKSAGTATINPAVLDATLEWNNAGYYLRHEIYRIPITGDGTLTIAVNNVPSSVIWGCVETLNIDAIDGTLYTNTGNGTAEATASMTGHAGGLMFEIAAEDYAPVSHTALSDQSIYENANASYMTGQSQYRLPAGTESVAISATLGATGHWGALGIVYKPVPAAAITGTATSSITEADIQAGNKTIIITLTGTTWVAN